MRDLWQIGSSVAGWAGILALFACWSHIASAQSAPPLVNDFMGGSVRSLEEGFQADLYVLGAFDGRRSVDRYAHSDVERAQPWKFYGRLGPMYFQNELERPRGFQFSLRRQGNPSLGSRAYIGIYRTFD